MRHGEGKLTCLEDENYYERVFEGKWVDDDLPHGTRTSKSGQKYVGDLVDL